jgi:hypothetical protein
MKKKIMTAIVAASLAAMTVGTVAFAAESPTWYPSQYDAVGGQTVETKLEGADKTKVADYAKALTVSTDIGVDFDVNAVGETSVIAANRVAQNLLSDVKQLGKDLDNDAIRDAASDSTKKVTATVLSVVNISPKTDYYDGTVTLNLEGVSANKTYVVLHYTDNYTGSWYGYGWEVITPEKVEDNKITIKTSDYSVYAIVEIGVDGTVSTPVVDPTANGQTATVTPAGATSGAGSSSSSSDSATTSPKTGEY